LNGLSENLEMRLRIRQDDGRVYEVDVPDGSRVTPSDGGPSAVLIAGQGPGDTCMMVPRPALLDAARMGLYGLVLRGEVAIGETQNPALAAARGGRSFKPLSRAPIPRTR
jgi:hypothetical protein